MLILMLSLAPASALAAASAPRWTSLRSLPRSNEDWVWY